MESGLVHPDQYLPFSRPVKLAQKNPLPGSEKELPSPSRIVRPGPIKVALMWAADFPSAYP